MKNLFVASLMVLSSVAQAGTSSFRQYAQDKVYHSELNIVDMSPDYIVGKQPTNVYMVINQTKRTVTLSFVHVTNNCPVGAMCLVGPTVELLREVKLPITFQDGDLMETKIIASRDQRPVDGDFQEILIQTVSAMDGGPTFANVTLHILTSGFNPERKVYEFIVNMNGEMRL